MPQFLKIVRSYCILTMDDMRSSSANLVAAKLKMEQPTCWSYNVSFGNIISLRSKCRFGNRTCSLYLPEGNMVIAAKMVCTLSP